MIVNRSIFNMLIRHYYNEGKDPFWIIKNGFGMNLTFSQKIYVLQVILAYKITKTKIYRHWIYLTR